MTAGGGGLPAPSGAGAGGNAGMMVPAPIMASGSGGSSAAPAGAGDTAVAGSQSTLDAGPNVADASGLDGGALDAGGDPGGCDRACLIAALHGYIDALVANDPSTLRLSTMLKYTDNGSTAQVGQGLWQTASGLRADTRLDYADPKQGQVATQLVIDENGTTPVMYQVRLKLVAGEITEIESMTVRQRGAANGFFSVENMKPEAMWSQPLAQPATREQLKAEVDLYLDYLEGMIDGADLHLDSACARYENGVRTANGTAAFERQSWSFDVTPRYLVFDEAYGIAWGMFPFTQAASSLVVGEAFKVVDGKIMMIRAVMANMPAKAWD